MMAAVVVTAIPPVILGRQELKLAPVLHNKVLYADADMNEAGAYLRGLDWVRTAGTRVRDEGQVFHVEGFVVPRDPAAATPERLQAARAELLELDRKVHDVVIATVGRLPEVLEPHGGTDLRRR